MSFKKLLEMTDKIAREELGNYYIISEARMNNYLYCLESGAKQVLKLKEDITTLQDQLQAAQALAATHLADQELLIARERRRVARECIDYVNNHANDCGCSKRIAHDIRSRYGSPCFDEIHNELPEKEDKE